ncbi:mitochondrial carnitine/acylcarnitine carrier-like protein [Tanacetum coccineum]
MQLILRFRLQAQGSSADSGVVAESGAAVTTAVKYDGPMDAANQVLRTERRVRSLFKGLFPTLTRGASADCRPKVQVQINACKKILKSEGIEDAGLNLLQMST